MPTYDPMLTESGRNRGKKIRAGITQQVQALANMQLDPETMRAYQMSQQMANMGLMGSTRALYNQGAGRSMNTALGAASAGRGTLRSIGGIMDQANQANLQLAAREEEARRNNMLMGINAAQQIGQQSLGLKKYKQEGLYNFYTGRKAERQRNFRSGMLLGGEVLGTVLGAALGSGGALTAAGKGPK